MGRLVPDWDVQRSGYGANVGLGQSGLHHGAADSVLGRGNHARTVVSDVIGIGAVDHPLDGFFFRQRCEFGVKLGLAEVAPLRRICHVALSVHLIGVDNAVGKTERFSQSDSLFKFAFGQGRRDCGDHQGLFTEHAVGRHGYQSAIYAP